MDSPGEAVKQLRGEEVRLADIARRLGCSHQTVAKWKFRGILPTPIRLEESNSGSTYAPRAIYDWNEIRAWAKETGRDSRMP